MARSMRKRRKRQIISMSEISLTPLIDTALTLLIIFMITAPMMQNSIKVNLPKGDAQESGNASQELVVDIDKDGSIFFEKTKMSCDALIEKLQKIVMGHQDKTVFVKADKDVNYGTVIEVVDQIKVVGGIKYVALATEKRV